MSKKQASYGALIDSFQSFLKTTKKASDQGKSESDVSVPGSDSEVKEILPNGGKAPASEPNNKVNERGVQSGEKLPDQAKNLPVQELERKEVSPSTKIAGETADALCARLSSTLKKVASAPATETPAAVEAPAATEQKEEKVASVETPAVEAPAVKEGEVDLDVLASKVASFIEKSEQGYQIAKQLFEQNDMSKVAAEQAQAEAEIVAAVEARYGQLKTAGLSDEQILAQLEIDGQADAEALAKQAHMAQVEEAVNQKVAEYQARGFSEEEIFAMLEKHAEADAEAMAAAAAAEGGAPEGGDIDPEQLQQLVGQAVSELQAAVEAGEITEDQALDLLREAGLDVDAILGMMQEGGAPEGGAPEAPAAPAAPEEGGEAEEKEEESEGEEKKEANADPAAAAGGGQLPPELEQAIQQIDQLLQAGAITEEQAIAAVEALLGGGAPEGGAPVDPAAAGGAPMPAPAPVA